MARNPLKIPENPGANAPLRLSVAAAIAFPDGSLTAAGLRKEAKRGTLVVERIAGKDYTTLAAIEEMRLRCRRPAKRVISDADSQALPPSAGSAPRSSAAPPVDTEKAREVALTMMRERGERYKTAKKSEANWRGPMKDC